MFFQGPISSTLFYSRRSSAGETAHNCEHSCKDLIVRTKEENLRKFRITTHLRLECSLRSDPNKLSATVLIRGSLFRGRTAHLENKTAEFSKLFDIYTVISTSHDNSHRMVIEQ
jgi:hypothetical protein